MTQSLINRALDDGAKERTMIEEAKEANDILVLHQTCLRLVDEREKIAKGFAAMIEGWAMLKADQPQPQNQPAIDAIERVAHEAIMFAREVVQAAREKR